MRDVRMEWSRTFNLVCEVAPYNEQTWRTDHRLQMNRLNLRNNRLNYKTLGKILIIRTYLNLIKKIQEITTQIG